MIPASTNLTVAATGLAAGLAAGLAVLCLPRRGQDTDPSSRLSRLMAPAAPVAAASRRASAFLRNGWSTNLGVWTRGRGERRQAEASAQIAPLAADLLAACLVSGATPARAAEAVAHALHPPEPMASASDIAAFELSSRFREVSALLRLGGSPAASWRPLGTEPGLLPLSQAAARACQSGAPPAEAVAWTADDLRAAHHSAGTATARQAGVRAVAPLTGCFLPAFLLIGVVPVVIGLAQKLLP